jgi:hypothetical protein
MTRRRLADSRALADYAVGNAPLRAARAQPATTALVASWARSVNGMARTVTYGRLSRNVPMEPADTVVLATCDDNSHVGHRMAQLDERIGATYEAAAVPVILSEFRLAAERLAALLKAAFPEAP